MNKKTSFAIRGGLIGGASFGIVNTAKQLSDPDVSKPFNWKDLFWSLLEGVVIGGVTGLAVGAYKDYKNRNEKPINTDEVMKLFLGEIRLDKSDASYQMLSTKADWLVHLLKKEFKGKLKHEPFHFGSTEKGTALKEGFDIDICLAFNHNAFASTAVMFFNVYDILRKYVGINGITDIREQKKSIGIFFLLKGIEYKIDILPQKISSGNGNCTSGYLYVNNKGLLEKPSRTKTDIELLNSISLSETQKKVLVILKDWKNRNHIPISSHLLQYLMIGAYSAHKKSVPRSLTNKVAMVLRYIRDNIEGITLSSIENTNNILTNISPMHKAEISQACDKIIREYEYQPNSIISMLS
jgi:hypothetical protein